MSETLASADLPGAIWASLPMAAVLIDSAGRVLEANSAAEALLNASARSLKGQPLPDRLQIDADLDDACARVRAHQAPLILNDIEVRVGGRAALPATVQVAPLAGQPGVLMLLIDPREFAERFGRTGAARTAAKSAIGMAEMLAHEIKNPLAGISGAAQLLAMGLSPEDQELTDLIVAETRRIVKLLEQVEQFGNVLPPDRRAVNLHDALDRARRLALVGFAADLTIIEEYDPSLPPTFADPDQLMQVFLNLIRNAAEAIGRARPAGGGTIRLRSRFDMALRLRRSDGSGAALPLVVEVIDDGPGIAPEIADHIFDPFVSGRENGTGLGLALVSKIVTDHDGLIAVDSVPGRTVFRVCLPVAPRADAKPKEA